MTRGSFPIVAALFFAIAIASAPEAHAADRDPLPPGWDCDDVDAMDNVGWRAALKGPDSVEAGKPAVFEIDVSILPDHLLYQERADVSLGEDVKDATLGTAEWPATKRKFDKLLGKEVDYWDGAKLPIRVPVTLTGKPGKRTVELVVTNQACNPCLCLFPTPISLSKRVTVKAATAAAAATVPAVAAATPAPTDPPAAVAPAPESAPAAVAPALGATAASASVITSQTRMAELIASNFLFALLVAFAGGVLISLTPCVYPMIPITIAVIGSQATKGGATAAQSRSRGFLYSLVYVAGITIVYATLGVIAARSGREFGFALRNPWVLLSVAAVFLALATSMFGAWNLQLPASVQTRLSTYQGSGVAGVFVTGLFAGIVAGPCTAPVLIGILISISTGAVGAFGGFALMTSFSVGMGLLFIALGTFSGLLSALPRSGAWMETVKHVFGVLLVAAALYFIDLAVPPFVFALALGASLVLLGVGLGAALRLDPDAPLSRRVSQGAGWLAAAAGIWFFLGGLSASGWGPQIASPTNVAVAPPARHGELPWVESESEGVRLAQTTGKPMLIDFWAEDCQACKELDAYTYTDTRVIAKATSDFVPVKIDLSTPLGTSKEQKALVDELRRKYRVFGLPKVTFIRPDGSVIEDDELTLYGFEKPDPFLDRMSAAKSCAPPATC